MVLYKYVSAERIDILQNRLIRFTQPNAMNDPFEARPDFEALATNERFAKVFADAVRQEFAYREYFWRRELTNLDQQALADRIEGDPNYAEQLHKDAGLPDPLPDTRSRTYDLCNVVGILSLSETPDNLLMWAHNAEEHTGFVIVLDGSHDFFRGDDSTQGFAKPERVQYSSNRPRTTIEEVSELELFLIKESNWEYEKEWRYLKYLDDADERFEEAVTPPIALFRLPPRCVNAVILGCRRSEELKNKIVALRRDDSEFRHLQIQQARMSTTHYHLIIKEIET